VTVQGWEGCSGCLSLASLQILVWRSRCLQGRCLDVMYAMPSYGWWLFPSTVSCRRGKHVRQRWMVCRLSASEGVCAQTYRAGSSHDAMAGAWEWEGVCWWAEFWALLSSVWKALWPFHSMSAVQTRCKVAYCAWHVESTCERCDLREW
jgi:hypothetical protein